MSRTSFRLRVTDRHGHNISPSIFSCYCCSGCTFHSCSHVTHNVTVALVVHVTHVTHNITVAQAVLRTKLNLAWLPPSLQRLGLTKIEVGVIWDWRLCIYIPDCLGGGAAVFCMH